MVRWGLYDTHDQLWMGTEDGPLTYPADEKGVALVAAATLNVQLFWTPGRVRALPYPEQGRMRQRDSVCAHMTPLEALARLEEGRSIG